MQKEISRFKFDSEWKVKKKIEQQKAPTDFIVPI